MTNMKTSTILNWDFETLLEYQANNYVGGLRYSDYTKTFLAIAQHLKKNCIVDKYLTLITSPIALTLIFNINKKRRIVVLSDGPSFNFWDIDDKPIPTCITSCGSGRTIYSSEVASLTNKFVIGPALVKDNEITGKIVHTYEPCSFLQDLFSNS